MNLIDLKEAWKDIFGNHAFRQGIKGNYDEIKISNEDKLRRGKKVSDFVGFIIRSVFCLTAIKYFLNKLNASSSFFVILFFTISILFAGLLLIYLWGTIFELIYGAFNIIGCRFDNTSTRVIVLICAILTAFSFSFSLWTLISDLANIGPLMKPAP
jgi:hypothetical protein